MRRVTAALLASLLALLALPAGAAARPKVVVTGQLRYADGTPAARTHVELTRVTGLGDALGALLVFGLTAGFGAVLCFDDSGRDALVACGNNTAATLTDSQGRYRFVLSGDAVDKPDRKFSLVAHLPRSSKRAPGAQVELHTHLVVGANPLPTLDLWQPQVSGPLSALTWTDLPGEAHPSYEKHYVATTGLALDLSAGPGDDLDPRLLEDTRGTFQLVAHGHRGSLGVIWTAPVRSYTGTAGAPASRGRRCVATIEQARGPVTLSRCWLTDGTYGSSYGGPRARHCYQDPAFADPMFHSPPVCELASVRQVEIDLGKVVPVAAVVARGECEECVLLSSADHVSWSSPAVGAAPGSVVDWKGEHARWFRVVAPSTMFGGRPQYDSPGARLGGRDLPDQAPGDVSRLTELSVWAAAPPPHVSAPGGSSSESTAGSASTSERHGATLVAAALLLLVTAGAAGYALGQRRRTGG